MSTVQWLWCGDGQQEVRAGAAGQAAAVAEGGLAPSATTWNAELRPELAAAGLALVDQLLCVGAAAWAGTATSLFSYTIVSGNIFSFVGLCC